MCVAVLCADWKVFTACKLCALMLKSSGRRRISGLEAFERIICIVPVSSVIYGN